MHRRALGTYEIIGFTNAVLASFRSFLHCSSLSFAPLKVRNAVTYAMSDLSAPFALMIKKSLLVLSTSVFSLRFSSNSAALLLPSCLVAYA